MTKVIFDISASLDGYVTAGAGRPRPLPLEGVADITLHAPFVQATRAEIVKIGYELGVPLERTWSCYKGGEMHCGACGTCYERREAFSTAGIRDRTRYAAEPIFPAR